MGVECRLTTIVARLSSAATSQFGSIGKVMIVLPGKLMVDPRQLDMPISALVQVAVLSISAGCRSLRILLQPMVALVLLFAVAAVLGQPANTLDRDEIRALIARGHLAQLRHPDFTSFRQALDDFYRDGGYQRQPLA